MTYEDVLDMLARGDVTKYSHYESVLESVARIKFLINEKKSFSEWFSLKSIEND